MPRADPVADGTDGLRIEPIGPRNLAALARFLSIIDAAGDASFFRPHGSSAAELDALCADYVRDLYYATMLGDDILAYGLLRGWDEGYKVPSLGIAVAPGYRGVGLGGAMMAFLHSAAQMRGAEFVRLRVHRDNALAIALYRTRGYRFDNAYEGELMVGIKELVK